MTDHPDNQQKYENYWVQSRRLESALRSGFYLEAVFVEYAINEGAWNSVSFESFRDRMRGACPGCGMRELCMGGRPLMPQVVLCDSKER